MPSVRLPAATHAAATAWARREPDRRVVGLVRWALDELAMHPQRAVVRAGVGLPSAPLGAGAVVVGMRPADAAAWAAAGAAVAGVTSRPVGSLVRGLIAWRIAQDEQREDAAVAA